MDTIHITGLEIFAHHGVYDEEKEKGQLFVINAAIGINTIKAGSSDDIDDTLDYGKLCEFIRNYMVKNQVNLLETLTNDLAKKILINYPQAESVILEICKPNAPIPMKFENVSIEVERKRHTAYISVGSNIGDRNEYIQNAIDNLGSDENISILKLSDLMETPPYGGVEQDDFLNGMIKISTLYTPEELLERLHEEEKLAHRERLIHWGPRTLDLDIIYYDNLIMSTDNLVIPHPDMANRLFVLIPLYDIAPYEIHPRFMSTTKELLDKLKR